MRRFWTDEELDVLWEFYPHIPTGEMAAYFRRTVAQVYQAAARIGVAKTEEYLRSEAGGHLRGASGVGVATRYQRGQVPHNKGIARRPGWAPGRMRQTQFKPGHRPHTWRPIGHERTTHDGYRERKMTDTGCSRRDYVGLHRMLWENTHGPVPAGMALAFRDGDQARIELSNLEVMSRADLMRRNSIHRLPKELVGLIQLTGQLKRKIRERHEKQDAGLAQPSV